MDEVTIEDLTFVVRYLMEVDLRGCLSEVSYTTAKKAERRMALKI